jgi:hypothetical protein
VPGASHFLQLEHAVVEETHTASRTATDQPLTAARFVLTRLPVEVERGDPVDKQGASEEVGNLVGWQARDSFDEGYELAVALAHDLAAFRIVAGSGGLESTDEPASLVTELGIGRGDCLERLLATLAGGCVLECVERSVRQRRTVASKRFRFVPNSRNMYGCENSDAPGDLLRRRALVATHSELCRRRFEHGFPPLHRRQSHRRRHLRLRVLGRRRAR